MAEKTALQLEREAVDLELAQLQLEDLRESSAHRRAIREQKARNQIAYQALLIENADIQKAKEEACPHRKGGKDLEGLRFGSSSNYSVVKHTLPMGDQMVVCQRCQKTWHKPLRAAFEVNGKLDQRAYKAALEEYKFAINMPTDNTPSGTRMFVLSSEAA